MRSSSAHIRPVRFRWKGKTRSASFVITSRHWLIWPRNGWTEEDVRKKNGSSEDPVLARGQINAEAQIIEIVELYHKQGAQFLLGDIACNQHIHPFANFAVHSEGKLVGLLKELINIR